MDPNDPAVQALIAQLVAQQLAAQPAAAPATRSNLPRPRAPDAWRGDREDACDIETWLFGVDAFFTAANVTTDTERFTFLPTLLTGNGQRWWMYLQQQAYAGGAALPTTWRAFVQAIVAQFQPVNSSETARAALCSIRQTAGVQAYAGRFRALLLRLPDISSADAIFRFVHGLKPHVQTMVRLSNPTTLDAAISAAERVDVISFKPTSRPTTYHGYASGAEPMELGAMAYDEDERGCDDEWDEAEEEAYQLAAVTMSRAVGRRPPMLSTAGRTMPPPPSPRPGAPLTAAQKDYARANGLCWACMKPGHTSAICPTKVGHPKGGPPPA